MPKWGRGGGTSRFNFIGIAGAIGISDNLHGNQIGAVGQPKDPKLTPLGDHGGPTRTHALLPGSLVIDSGATISLSQLTVDQRGSSRAVDRPNEGITTFDIGAVELSTAFGASTGDFNGDGRQDTLLFDPTTLAITVVEASTLSGGLDVASWGTLPADASQTGSLSFIVGDFNGDGRDDVLVRTYVYMHVAISDGTSFIIHQQQPLPGSFVDIYAGDIDNDGNEDLVAWNGSNAPGFGGYAVGWRVAKYIETTGKFVVDGGTSGIWNPDAGDESLFRESGAKIFVADANRDGRADLIRRTSGGQWGVALSQAVPAGTASGQFVNQGNWSTTWFNDYYDGVTLDADGPIQKIIDTFEDVYNNIELELYPGLMKGPTATALTKAGNDWDQAALLVDRLEAAGFDADIASGFVKVDADEAAKWLGMATASAAFSVIESTIDKNATEVGDDIRFKHAWVQLEVPWSPMPLYLDSSWKFKDRPATAPVVPTSFDEFAFLGQAGAQTPAEYFEDQVLQYLANTGAGNSLTDVPFNGPIRQQYFNSIPSSLGFNVTVDLLSLLIISLRLSTYPPSETDLLIKQRFRWIGPLTPQREPVHIAPRQVPHLAMTIHPAQNISISQLHSFFLIKDMLVKLTQDQLRN